MDYNYSSVSIVTSSAILAATSSIDSSIVLNPLREPSNGLTSRKSSKVVLCTIGTSKSRANRAESSLSATPSPLIRSRNEGVTNTIPIRDFTKPLSISRSNDEPKGTYFSLNQTVTPLDSSMSCNSLAAPLRSSQAWQRKTSRKSGNSERFTTFSRTGVSVRISAGEYKIVEPLGDQRAHNLSTIFCDFLVKNSRYSVFFYSSYVKDGMSCLKSSRI